MYRGLALVSDPSLPGGGANCSKPDIGVVVMNPLLPIVPGVGRGESMGGIDEGGGTARGLVSKKLGTWEFFVSGLVWWLVGCLGLCDMLGVDCSVDG